MTMSPHDPTRLPMHEYQRRYWAKWNQNPRCTSFHTPLAFRIRGALDKVAFKQACAAVLRAQEVTRAFYNDDGTEQYLSDLSVDDVFVERTLDPEADVEAQLRVLFREPFDLSRGPLVRFYLCRFDEHTQYFVLSAHHIITDAVWGPTMVATIAEAYRARLAGREPATLQGPTYQECIEKMQRSVKPARKAKARTFWHDYLKNAPRTVAVPRLQSSEFAHRAAASIFFDLDSDVARQARRFADQRSSTLFIVLSAMFGFVLARAAGQEVVLSSYPLDMRPYGHGHLVGCFVNLALIKATVRPHTTLGELVDELTVQRKRVRPHWHYSIRDLVCTGGEIDADIEETFFSVFFGETFLNTAPLKLEGVEVDYVTMPWSDEFDRELRLLYDASQPQGIRCRMDYRRAHYDPAVIDRMVDEFQAVLARALVDERPLGTLADELTPCTQEAS